VKRHAVDVCRDCRFSPPFEYALRLILISKCSRRPIHAASVETCSGRKYFPFFDTASSRMYAASALLEDGGASNRAYSHSPTAIADGKSVVDVVAMANGECARRVDG
jgi:hypothetical protein